MLVKTLNLTWATTQGHINMPELTYWVQVQEKPQKSHNCEHRGAARYNLNIHDWGWFDSILNKLMLRLFGDILVTKLHKYLFVKTLN